MHALLAVALVPAATAPARAQSSIVDILPLDFVNQEIALVVALLAAMIFAVFSTISLMASRDRLADENKALKGRLGELRGVVDRAEALVSEEGQRLVAWSDEGEAALVAGSLAPETGVPADEATLLDFPAWLEPDSAKELVELTAALRTRAAPFATNVRTRAGAAIEASGWVTGGSGALRFRDLSGDRAALADLRARHQALAGEHAGLRAMLQAVPLPAWQRNAEGALVWVNDAYATAVEAADGDQVTGAALELFDTAGRDAMAAARGKGEPFNDRLPAIVGGSRRLFAVVDVATGSGSAGIAVDVTEAEDTRAALRREVAFNARTLDQLQTAVAIFGPDRRMRSCNAAYRALFDLDAAFLGSGPDEEAILDELRAARQLPEQADFRAWRTRHLSAYRSPETREQPWHLPDGRTLRVIANPHPGGGMTWIYEDVTERLDLESRYNTLKSVQGETLDHLSEGVAVFGSDGRLRLFNPALVAIWSLDRDRLADGPHVSDLVAAFSESDDGESRELWHRFTAAVAGLDESRAGAGERLERKDGTIVDYATVPLPDGQTLVTFVDVTDSANMARALVDRNEALEAADRLKNDFIRHVSYELRSPLTNIIGFSQLLKESRVGPLNDKQAEYMSYVLSSSNALLTIINDILDLTTIDAGVMELDISEVSLATAIEEALDDVRAKAGDRNVAVALSVAPGTGRIVADPRRIHQVLFNLISNAVEYSEDDGRVEIAAERTADGVWIEVRDDGPGMPTDFVPTAFDRFSSMHRGGSRGGTGLGLAIVKSFVELHGGEVTLESSEGQGTKARVELPLRPRIAAVAAE